MLAKYRRYFKRTASKFMCFTWLYIWMKEISSIMHKSIPDMTTPPGHLNCTVFPGAGHYTSTLKPLGIWQRIMSVNVSLWFPFATLHSIYTELWVRGENDEFVKVWLVENNLIKLVDIFEGSFIYFLIYFNRDWLV